MQRICPHCGEDDSKKVFVGDICFECTLKQKSDALPTGLKITVCTKCSKMLWEGKFIDYDEKKIVAKMEKMFQKSGFELSEYDWDSQVAKVILRISKESQDFEYSFPLKVQKVCCPSCSKQAGNYFEAIIQLRGDSKKVEENKKKIVKRLQKDSFIQDIRPAHSGFDIYVGYKKGVPEAIKGVGIKPMITHKLSGQRKDGKRLYRTTYLLKFEKE
jgi:nonsense-mediated mRNA decay protein 3